MNAEVVMRDLFERLIQDGEAGIKQLVQEGYQESVDLEFCGGSGFLDSGIS
jgi:hypothetical protein